MVAETKAKKLKFKVVAYAEYLAKAREEIKASGADGDVWNKAIELLYEDNEVVDIVQKGGETRFVCKG